MESGAEVLTSSANGGGGLPGEAKAMMAGAAMFAVAGSSLHTHVHTRVLRQLKEMREALN